MSAAKLFRCVDRLFRETLSGGYDSRKPWAAVKELRSISSRLVFDRAARWCASARYLKRARAADVLSQLASPARKNPQRPYTPRFREESFALLSQMLKSEQNERTLGAIIFALGHVQIEDAVALVHPFADHPSEDVRFAVTSAFGQFTQNEAAVRALVRLTEDKSKDIRNWAMFAVGTQSDLDYPELRNALVRGLNDPYLDAREEAIAGLAKRKDPRAVPGLRKLLRSGKYFVHHEYDYSALLEQEIPEGGWNADLLLEALDQRFPLLASITEKA